MNVKMIKGFMPKVYINNNAMNKMQEYIRQCDNEIGWLGCAEKIDGAYHITDVFLFEQEVHSTTTEITTEGLNNFAMELMKTNNGIETWNNMRVWGHSHVNMSTSPSSQDESQMDLFLENTNDFFIRIIANKKDNFRIDIYDYEIGICYTEVPYDLMFDNETEKQVNKLSLQIRTLKDRLEKLLNPSEDLAKEIESEIKNKVREKVIVKNPTYKTYYGGYQQSWNTNLTKEKKKIITDSKEFFNELTDIEIFYIAETLENGGALSDLFEDYEFKGTTEYEIEDMVLEYSEAYPEKYYEYLSTGGY